MLEQQGWNTAQWRHIRFCVLWHTFQSLFMMFFLKSYIFLNFSSEFFFFFQSMVRMNMHHIISFAIWKKFAPGRFVIKQCLHKNVSEACINQIFENIALCKNRLLIPRKENVGLTNCVKLCMKTNCLGHYSTLSTLS